MSMTKEHLLAYIEMMTPEQIELLGDLISLANYPEFQLKKKLSGIGPSIDTAIPVDYANQLRQDYPDFDNGHHVYDYNGKSFGEMRNLNNMFVKNVLEGLKINGGI